MTTGLVTLVWVWFGVQFWLAPATGMKPHTEPWVSLFAVETAQPFDAVSWIVASISHIDWNHAATNTMALGIVLPIVEDSHTSRFALVCAVLGGSLTMGVSALLFASLRLTEYYLLGASAVWSSLLPAAFLFGLHHTVIRVKSVPILVTPAYIVVIMTGYFALQTLRKGLVADTAHMGHLLGVGVGIATVFAIRLAVATAVRVTERLGPKML